MILKAFVSMQGTRKQISEEDIAEFCKTLGKEVDKEVIKDTASYADPHSLSEGVKHLIVNGIVTIEDGNETLRRGGEFI